MTLWHARDSITFTLSHRSVVLFLCSAASTVFIHCNIVPCFETGILNHHIYLPISCLFTHVCAYAHIHTHTLPLPSYARTHAPESVLGCGSEYPPKHIHTHTHKHTHTCYTQFYCKNVIITSIFRFAAKYWGLRCCIVDEYYCFVYDRHCFFSAGLWYVLFVSN